MSPLSPAPIVLKATLLPLVPSTALDAPLGLLELLPPFLAVPALRMLALLAPPVSRALGLLTHARLVVRDTTVLPRRLPAVLALLEWRVRTAFHLLPVLALPLLVLTAALATSQAQQALTTALSVLRVRTARQVKASAPTALLVKKAWAPSRMVNVSTAPPVLLVRRVNTRPLVKKTVANALLVMKVLTTLPLCALPRRILASLATPPSRLKAPLTAMIAQRASGLFRLI